MIPGGVPSVTDALVNLTMTTKFFGLPYVDPSYWTLSFELAFYVAIASLLAIRGLHRLEESAWHGWPWMPSPSTSRRLRYWPI